MYNMYFCYVHCYVIVSLMPLEGLNVKLHHYFFLKCPILGGGVSDRVSPAGLFVSIRMYNQTCIRIGSSFLFYCLCLQGKLLSGQIQFNKQEKFNPTNVHWIS